MRGWCRCSLAEQTRLPQIIADKVSIKTPRIKSGAANPVPKLLGVIAGMGAGADSIEDLDALRAGGMAILFDGISVPSTLGTLLREFSFGHARQLESVLREHPVAMAGRTQLLIGIDERAFIDIDSLSTCCCARCTGTPSRAPPADTPRSPANRASSASSSAPAPSSPEGLTTPGPSRPTGRSPGYLLGHLLRGSCAARCVHGPAEEPLDEGESDALNANQKLNLDDFP
jgi:hypothetical protein